ncbi:UNVERIFIED_ORG: hypothetical protein ABID33_002238 [Xanthobacter viscosus]
MPSEIAILTGVSTEITALLHTEGWAVNVKRVERT